LIDRRVTGGKKDAGRLALGAGCDMQCQALAGNNDQFSSKPSRVEHEHEHFPHEVNKFMHSSTV
jgi:hypothetical protein